MLDDAVRPLRDRALYCAAEIVEGKVPPYDGAVRLSEMGSEADGIVVLQEQLAVFAALADARIEGSQSIEAHGQSDREIVAAAEALRRRYLAFPSRHPTSSEHEFGDGTLEFGRWETPFENTDVEVMEIAYAPGATRWREEHRSRWERRAVLKSPFGAELVLLIRVHVSNVDEPGYPDDLLYRVTFKEYISAFRVLDEGGLPEFWTAEDAPVGRTTFRVRNHGWSRESVLSFIAGDEEGWSYVIATHGDCVEVVSRDAPDITIERT